MAFSPGAAFPFDKSAAGQGRAVALIFLSALVFCGTAWIVPAGVLQIGTLAVGLTLAFVAAWITLRGNAVAAAENIGMTQLSELIGNDMTPCILASAEGQIHYRNPAARDHLGTTDTATLAAALQPTLANPGAILFRMEMRAMAEGACFEDVVTRKGHLRISVHRAGPEKFLWRIEKSADRPQIGGTTIPLPAFTLGRNDAVLWMNKAARDLLGERVHALDRICVSLPLVNGQVNEISTKEGSVSCFVYELEGTAGRREVFLLPLDTSPGPPSGPLPFFDALPVPLLKLTRSGEISMSNRLARDLLGANDCTGRLFGDLTEGLGRSISEWLDDAAMRRGTIQPETLRVRREDAEVFVQVTLNRLVENGDTVLVAVLHDATQLKSLEAQFVQSQKMQAIGQLAGGVAHDFNNLLTAISGHCDLLLLRHDQGDSEYADLVQISQNANRAAALVGQLLAYSRKQTLRPEVIDMRDTLSDLAHLLNRLVGETVSLTLTHDPLLAPIRADKRQLEQVIMNLVVNARDAMRAGGKIRIETANVVLEEPLRRDRATVAPGRYVSVRVTDAGHGIPEGNIEKVFEPFFTTKRVGEGTGLGLSTAYGIVKQSGGFIFVDSQEGEGTSFQILLPAYTEAVATHGAGQVVPPPAPQDQVEGVVLLVEDEAPVRAFASRALQLRGFTVLEADSAEAALDLLADADLRVDVFVTDVVMPGSDGPTWVRQALRDRPDVKVVFMSGYAEESFGDAQSRIPNSVFLPKPFSLSELTDTVQRQLG